jgi:hypothetical protein
MRRKLFIAAGSALMFCLLTAALPLISGSAYTPLRLPNGKKFPTSQSDLLKIRDDQDAPGMQAHAWDIFAGLVNGGGGQLPIWETWFTKCDTGAVSPACNRAAPSGQPNLPVLRSLEIPTQLVLGSLQSAAFDPLLAAGQQRVTSESVYSNFLKQFREHPQFASVLFNRPAKQHILCQKLFTGAGIKSVYDRRASSHSPAAENEIDPFPAGSVVLKTTWELAYDNGGKVPTIYIPNQTVLAAKRTAGSNQTIQDPSDWGTSVKIDTTSGTLCGSGDYLAQGDVSVPVVPLDCFYSYEFKTTADANAFPRDLAGFTGPSGIIAGHTFLILVAVHAITKETPDWVWTTFWWQNTVNQAPPIVKGNRWRHFFMDTTLSDTTPLDSSDSGPKICFNPYLEARFPNGIVSNCARCHERAVYSPTDQHAKVLEGLDLGSPWRDGTPANNRAKNPRYFDGALRTDFIWSLADQQDPSVKAFLDGLRQFVETP